MKIDNNQIHFLSAGILAERLRFGTKGLFANQQRPAKPKAKTEVASATSKFKSHPSIDSANTISNSSLQDFDETEFTGTELARYMRELNFDLVTWRPFSRREGHPTLRRFSLKNWWAFSKNRLVCSPSLDRDPFLVSTNWETMTSISVFNTRASSQKLRIIPST